jgi:hypothetical protein
MRLTEGREEVSVKAVTGEVCKCLHDDPGSKLQAAARNLAAL